MAQSMRKRLRKRRQKRSLRKQLFGGIGGQEGSSSQITPSKMDSSSEMTPNKMESSTPMTPSSTPTKTSLFGALNDSFIAKKKKSLIPGAKLYTETADPYSSYPPTSSNSIRKTIHSTPDLNRPGLSMYTVKKPNTGGRRTQKKRR